jgi:hypothetical protein
MKDKAESKKQKAKILAATARSARAFLLFAFCFLLCPILAENIASARALLPSAFCLQLFP